jgi:hypothetical protein
MFEHTCTDIGCESGVFVQVTPKSGRWQSGRYLLRVTLDDKQVTCDFAIASDAASADSPIPVNCGKSVRGALSGPADALELSSNSQPKTLRIDLSRDDASVLSEQRTLAYTETQPNAGCVPICRNATVSFTIAEP